MYLVMPTSTLPHGYPAGVLEWTGTEAEESCCPLTIWDSTSAGLCMGVPQSSSVPPLSGLLSLIISVHITTFAF
jgi:hypothetical protein